MRARNHGRAVHATRTHSRTYRGIACGYRRASDPRRHRGGCADRGGDRNRGGVAAFASRAHPRTNREAEGEYPSASKQGGNRGSASSKTLPRTNRDAEGQCLRTMRK